MVTTSFFEGAPLPGMGANRARASNCTAQRRRRTKRIVINKGNIFRTNKQTSSKNIQPKVAKVKWAAKLGIRHKFGKRNVSSPSGWSFKPVQEELGGNHIRQFDPSHDPRSKTGICFHTAPPSDMPTTAGFRKDSSLIQRGGQIIPEKSNCVPAIEDGTGFVSPVFVVPMQGRRSVVSSDKPQGTKSLRNSATLQDGINQNSKIPNSKG